MFLKLLQAPFLFSLEGVTVHSLMRRDSLDPYIEES